MMAAGSGGATVAGLGMVKVSHHCLPLACQKPNLASLWAFEGAEAGDGLIERHRQANLWLVRELIKPDDGCDRVCGMLFLGAPKHARNSPQAKRSQQQ